MIEDWTCIRRRRHARYLHRRCIGCVFRKYPKFAKVLQNRHHMYNRTLAYIKEEAEKRTVLVIRPAKPLEIGRLENNPDKIQEIYEIGYQDGLSALEQVKMFLKIPG